MAQELSDAKLYDQWCADIRATDEISFKLIGIVPLVSGTGLITILFTHGAPSPMILITLSLFAAAITLGLFRWELRNLQNCKWLIYYVGELEKKVLDNEPEKESLEVWPDPPQRIGKSEAEKFIYAVTIVTWLVLPSLLLTSDQRGPWFWKLYVPVSIVIALATVVSLFAGVKPPKPGPNPAA
jgi:nitrogen fixation-related uncharacterized protein